VIVIYLFSDFHVTYSIVYIILDLIVKLQVISL